MGRPREFDEDELLEKAMLAFWEKGLQKTSMRELEAKTGVKQVSLYNAFGDKEGLFLAVLDRYADLVLHTLDQHLDNRDLNGITAYVESNVSPECTYPHIMKVHQAPSLVGFDENALAIGQNIQARCRQGLPQKIALVLIEEFSCLRVNLLFGPIFAVWRQVQVALGTQLVQWIVHGSSRLFELGKAGRLTLFPNNSGLRYGPHTL